jgi:hypothetical protein
MAVPVIEGGITFDVTSRKAAAGRTFRACSVGLTRDVAFPPTAVAGARRVVPKLTVRKFAVAVQEQTVCFQPVAAVRL